MRTCRCCRCTQVLCKALEAEQSSLPTTAQQDREALARKQLRRGGAETLTLRFRIEKKAVLEAALQAARQRSNQLKRGSR